MEQDPAMTGKSRKTGSNRKGLPEYLRPFFWDVDLQKLSVEESSYFIISRLMEHGDEKAFVFLLKNYSQNEMIHVLKNSRSLSRRSRGFWKIFFNVEDELCTPKRYPTPYGNCSVG
ncbi:MAG: hypothetical protein KAT27_01215 [Desulfobacterales bacterium]|nr:hypothetical protein [Desulfobacterales bacterium]